MRHHCPLSSAGRGKVPWLERGQSAVHSKEGFPGCSVEEEIRQRDKRGAEGSRAGLNCDGEATQSVVVRGQTPPVVSLAQSWETTHRAWSTQN